MQVVMTTASGEAHGLINTLANHVPFDDFKHFTPTNKARIEKEKKEDSRMVKVEYLNSRGRHERLTKPYCRYSGDPIQIYHLIPGQVYTVPLGFVNEVNDVARKLKKRSGLLSVDDKQVNSDGSPLSNDIDGEWLHKLVPVGF